MYTNIKFTTIDDELLVKDLKIKDIPILNNEEKEEFNKILTYSAPRMLEYFNIAKSVWEIVFDSVILRIKKNKNEVLQKKGYFYYLDSKDNLFYVWEFNVKQVNKKSPESKTLVNLIYSEKKNNLTITKIINTFLFDE
jgi:succinate dehydrogenase flavin-adding protein (antitoxin of CptAB toxin-antitoxin module)